jgi:hypothetical protein
MRKNISTTETFIKKSYLKHGYVYDYSKCKYSGRTKKVTIICKIHGEFEQRAGHHLQGQGCKSCGLIRMSSKIKTWTDNDDKFLIDNYIKFGAPYCSEILNKTLSSIYHRVKILELKKNSKKLNHAFIPGRLWSNLIANAKNRNIKVFITPDDIYNTYIKQNKKCALSGLDLVFSFNSELNSASVDRINSKQNYTKDNIQIVHKTINQCKMDLSNDDFYKMCKYVFFNLSKNTQIK